jgi:hypothetical protein
MNLLRLGLLFCVGLTVWGLTLARSAAWDARRKNLLCGIVMADEAVGVFTGMWLARNGTYWEGLACVLGAGVAARLVMWWSRE